MKNKEFPTEVVLWRCVVKSAQIWLKTYALERPSK